MEPKPVLDQYHGKFVTNGTGGMAPFDIANNTLGWAATAPESQASVTVGLEGVHPICMSDACTAPTAAPWTNVRVKSYSDWGVVLRYATNPVTDKTGGLTITMANGSPFVWFEKPASTKNNFIVWVVAMVTSVGFLRFHRWHILRQERHPGVDRHHGL